MSEAARRDGEMRVDEYTARVHDREWEAAPGGRDWTPGELTAALYAACVDRRALIRILDQARHSEGASRADFAALAEGRVDDRLYMTDPVYYALAHRIARPDATSSRAEA